MLCIYQMPVTARCDVLNGTNREDRIRHRRAGTNVGPALMLIVELWAQHKKLNEVDIFDTGYHHNCRLILFGAGTCTCTCLHVSYAVCFSFMSYFMCWQHVRLIAWVNCMSVLLHRPTACPFYCMGQLLTVYSVCQLHACHILTVSSLYVSLILCVSAACFVFLCVSTEGLSLCVPSSLYLERSN